MHCINLIHQLYDPTKHINDVSFFLHLIDDEQGTIRASDFGVQQVIRLELSREQFVLLSELDSI